MKLINRSLLFLFLVIGTLFRAEEIPEAPAPPGGGGGGVGPGAISSPIDMYVYILAVVAILFMVYFARKNQKKII